MTWQKTSASRGILDGRGCSRRCARTRSEAVASSRSAKSLPNRVSPEALAWNMPKGRRLRQSGPAKHLPTSVHRGVGRKCWGGGSATRPQPIDAATPFRPNLTEPAIQSAPHPDAPHWFPSSQQPISPMPLQQRGGPSGSPTYARRSTNMQGELDAKTQKTFRNLLQPASIPPSHVPQGGGKRRFYSPYSMHLPWRESWLIDVASF